jgi:hypothetical protein
MSSIKYEYFVSDNELECEHFLITITKCYEFTTINYTKTRDHPFYHTNLFHNTITEEFKYKNATDSFDIQSCILKIYNEINEKINEYIDSIDLQVSHLYISEYCSVDKEIFELEKNKYKNMMIESKLNLKNLQEYN